MSTPAPVPPPTVVAVAQNPITAAIVGIIDAVYNGGVIAAQTYISSQVPFLALPVISTFVGWVLDGIESSVEKQTTLIVANVVDEVQTQMQNSAVVQATQALAAAQKSGDANAITQANQNAVTAWRNLGNFNGS
jgi:hypothetical protein